MVRRTMLTAFLLVAGFCCVTMIAQADAGSSGASGFKPTASVDSLMHGMGEQFKKINELLKDKETNKRMKRVHFRAELLAELSNVNRFNTEKDDYRQWATQVRDIAMQLANEAHKKSKADESKLTALVGQIKDVCTACHDQYQE